MSERYTGVPTTYRGRRMRSRLEARWAAMFDSLGWVWEYEPMDLRGWIPDFLVHFQQGDLLVEVKGPIEEMGPAKHKIEESGWEGEVMLLGASPSWPWFGEVVDLHPSKPGFEWGTCRVFFCLSCGEHSLCNDDDSHACRRCGETEGHTGEVADLEQRWIESGNRVQWRAT